MLGILQSLETSIAHLIKHKQKKKPSILDIPGSEAGVPTALQWIISKGLTRTFLVWILQKNIPQYHVSN